MTEAEVKKLMPEIDLIESEELRARSVACWKQVLELGGWEQKDLQNAPLAPGHVAAECPEKGLDHCRRVARVCQLVWDELGAWANEIGELDHDTLLCGAVLHDIGKFLEYDLVDGKPCLSEQSKYYSHVVSGAYIAKANGLPDKIVHMILEHSDMQSPPSACNYPELMMLKKLDHMCYSIAAMAYPEKK
ncbi:MAG: HD domain-containing protein [Oscillospiraceae bacterium]|nr:HD domain-containing protein [Oscillospiraceae bacterium]